MLCGGLPRHGIDTSVVSVYASGLDTVSQRDLGVPLIDLRRRRRGDYGYFPALVSTLRELRPDIVHAHLHTGQYPGRIAALLAGVPSIVLTVHGHEPGGPIRWALDRVLHARTARFVVFTQNQRQRYAHEQRVPGERIAVIPNGAFARPPAARRVGTAFRAGHSGASVRGVRNRAVDRAEESRSAVARRSGSGFARRRRSAPRSGRDRPARRRPPRTGPRVGPRGPRPVPGLSRGCGATVCGHGHLHAALDLGGHAAGAGRGDALRIGAAGHALARSRRFRARRRSDGATSPRASTARRSARRSFARAAPATPRTAVAARASASARRRSIPTQWSRRMRPSIATSSDEGRLPTSLFPYAPEEQFFEPEIRPSAGARGRTSSSFRSPGRRRRRRHISGLPVATLHLPMLGTRVFALALREFARAPVPARSPPRSRLRWRGSSSPRALVNLMTFPKSLAVASEVRRLGIDHVHAAWLTTPATVAYVVWRLTGVEFSTSAHSHDIFARNMVAEKVRTARFTRVISERNCRRMRRELPAALAARCVVGHLGVDLPPDAPAPPEREPRIVCVARLHPVKGHVYLLERCACWPTAVTPSPAIWPATVNCAPSSPSVCAAWDSRTAFAFWATCPMPNSSMRSAAPTTTFRSWPAPSGRANVKAFRSR